MYNINTIEYLKAVFKKLKAYEVDISVYENMLNEATAKYEENKKDDLIKDMQKNKAELKMNNLIALLDLIHATNGWNLDGDFEDVFNNINI